MAITKPGFAVMQVEFTPASGATFGNVSKNYGATFSIQGEKATYSITFGTVPDSVFGSTKDFVFAINWSNEANEPKCSTATEAELWTARLWQGNHASKVRSFDEWMNANLTFLKNYFEVYADSPVVRNGNTIHIEMNVAKIKEITGMDACKTNVLESCIARGSSGTQYILPTLTQVAKDCCGNPVGNPEYATSSNAADYATKFGAFWNSYYATNYPGSYVESTSAGGKYVYTIYLSLDSFQAKGIDLCATNIELCILGSQKGGTWNILQPHTCNICPSGGAAPSGGASAPSSGWETGGEMPAPKTTPTAPAPKPVVGDCFYTDGNGVLRPPDPPSGVTVSNVTATTVDVSWNRVRDAKAYIVSVGNVITNPSFWKFYPVCEPNDSFTVPDLQPNIEYGVIVYTNCSSCEAFNAADRKSTQRNMVTFKTAGGTAGLSGPGLPWIVTITDARIYDMNNNVVGVIAAGIRLGRFVARNERWIWFVTKDEVRLKVRASEVVIE